MNARAGKGLVEQTGRSPGKTHRAMSLAGEPVRFAGNRTARLRQDTPSAALQPAGHDAPPWLTGCIAGLERQPISASPPLPLLRSPAAQAGGGVAQSAPAPDCAAKLQGSIRLGKEPEALSIFLQSKCQNPVP